MDRIERLGRSTIQHGPESDRIYLMKLDAQDLDSMPAALITKARQHGYGKVFCKLPAMLARPFVKREYRVAAEVPNLFFGLEKGVFLSYFLSAERRRQAEEDQQRIQDILKLAFDQPQGEDPKEIPSKFRLRELAPEDAEALAELYAAVFDSYPFPIFDPAYLRQTMDSHIRYTSAFGKATPWWPPLHPRWTWTAATRR